ncbi:MAG: subfamily B ATP-binding cassette protein MsbA [Cyclobacteriaceae bacterium]|jgi:subfamily B ATP-binding cassette protein MsbA
MLLRMTDAAAPRTTDLQIYGRLLKYVLPLWGAFVCSIFGFVIYSVANVGFAQLISYIVDSLQGSDPLINSGIANSLKDLLGGSGSINRTVIPLAIVGIVFFRGVGTFIGNYFITYVGTSLVHTLRCELFDQLLCLPSRFYDKNSMGHLVAKVTFHVTQVTGAATDAVRVVIREGFTVMGYVGYLLFLNWRLTLIFIAVVPLIGFLASYAGRRFRRISERIQDSMGDVTHVASEAVQGYHVVRIFGGAEYERQRFEAVSQDNRRQSMKMVITQSIATPAVQLVVSFALAGLVWLVLDPELLADMSPGDVVAFITAGGLLAKPIRQLSEVNVIIQRGLAAAQDIFTLFDQPTEPDRGHLRLDRVRGKVEFRNVCFAYDEASSIGDCGDAPELVLDNVSFVAEAGQTIALVGRSGSGKSTMASLIPRFYTPLSGEILIDDQPVESIQLADLRQQIALVTQHVTLFNDTVGKNIAYGSLQNASREDVKKAAQQAYALDFIEQLDEGFDTVVGDNGVLLSGGQRQRLAIARAFLKDAPILILDEATSALDSESERYIQAALEAVVKGRTTIVIAHRLSTIEKADRILVIDKGKIVEQGNHQQLLEEGGFYASLHGHPVKTTERASELSQARVAGVANASSLTPVISTLDQASMALGGLSRESLVRAWYRDAPWLRVLTPVAWLFSGLAQLRRRNILGDATRHWQAPVPVIIVGNITLGGTGKSPLVLAIADYLQRQGFTPGIVSRGYGGDAHYPLDVKLLTDPMQCGDEALMLVSRSGCPMVVDPDRVAAVKHLFAQHTIDVIISDDGLQHYALERDVEIAVVDGQRGLGNGLCLPAGPLREPPSRLTEVDFVVVNGPEHPLLPIAAMAMQLVPKNLVHLLSDDVESLQTTRLGYTVHGVAGIGNPQRFFLTLRSLGYEVIEHAFADHHNFTLTDLMFGDSLPVIMTEKDAVKVSLLNPDILHQQFWYLRVEASLPDAFWAGLLDKLTHPRSGGPQLGAKASDESSTKQIT